MSQQPLISIITVNFNQTGVTLELLDSIRNSSYANLEVIVVDNGSTETPEAAIKKSYPEVTYIESAKNLGFAGGNNLGINAAKGDFYFLVNNDTEFSPKLVENMLNRFQSEKIGVVSPKIRYHHTPDMIQYAGYTRINSFTARNAAIGSRQIDRGQFDTARETPYAHGAAMMIKREVVQTVGLMPEVFFLYYEELDWCEKIRQAGYTIWYEPSALILHKESISVGKMSVLKTYFITRNRILFMKRNMAAHQVIGFALFLVFLTIPKNSLGYILRKEWSHLRAFWSAIMWNMNIPVKVKFD